MLGKAVIVHLNINGAICQMSSLVAASSDTDAMSWWFTLAISSDDVENRFLCVNYLGMRLNNQQCCILHYVTCSFLGVGLTL